MVSAAGNSLCIFDPGCAALPGPPGEGAARDFQFAGTGLAARFPDQFSCWDFAGAHDFDQPVNDTLIRLPLRTKAQLEAKAVFKVPPPMNCLATLMCCDELTCCLALLSVKSTLKSLSRTDIPLLSKVLLCV